MLRIDFGLMEAVGTSRNCLDYQFAIHSFGTFTHLSSSFVMKIILAIIQPTKLHTVRDALKQAGFERMTVCDAQGFGRQRGQTESYRGHQYHLNLIRKVCLEIAVHDDAVDRAIETVQRAARTGTDGNIGDGKIFILPMDDAIRIGQTVRGPEAV
jgi:nitrogen regulatory protein P-II 1